MSPQKLADNLGRPKLPYPENGEWTFEMIDMYHAEIARVAAHYGLDTYPNQLEIITSDQMLDAYASIGLPVYYKHWSFGKHHLSQEKAYKAGQMGLAYEIVINSSPCISYLMESNTMMMQALVIAHAAYGHNSFFKGNYLFRANTRADTIIEYLLFARDFITECEEKHGRERVELLLDSSHALMNQGVDRYKHPARMNVDEERKRASDRAEWERLHVNPLFVREYQEKQNQESEENALRRRLGELDEPQENILYFIEKNAPNLEKWEREIVRIVRKVAQYFYPQRQTQVMNEGWATFWHYTIIHHLYDEGLLDDGFMVEFLKSHTSVVAQMPVDSKHYSGINPYSLGFEMYRDLKRIASGEHWDGTPCSPELLAEDREWFPGLVGRPWLAVLKEAMANYKDESFIRQYLSPYLMREMRLISIFDSDDMEAYVVEAIHNDDGYRVVRNHLSDQYDLSKRDPDIQVVAAKMRTDRSLVLRYVYRDHQRLDEKAMEACLAHCHRLWGFKIVMEASPADPDDIYAYPEKEETENGRVVTIGVYPKVG